MAASLTFSLVTSIARFTGPLRAFHSPPSVASRFNWPSIFEEHSEVVEAAPPTYGVILLEAGRVVVHEESFLADWRRYDLRTGERIDLVPA